MIKKIWRHLVYYTERLFCRMINLVSVIKSSRLNGRIIMYHHVFPPPSFGISNLGEYCFVCLLFRPISADIGKRIADFF